MERGGQIEEGDWIGQGGRLKQPDGRIERAGWLHCGKEYRMLRSGGIEKGRSD